MIYSLIDNEKLNEKTNEKINFGYEFSNNFGYKTYYCKNCCCIESHFSFSLKKKNEIFTPKYRCSYCNKIIKKIKIDWKIIDNEIILFEKDKKLKLICPKCYGNKFDVGDLVNWD